ncbi:MAG: hypothetical protein V1914_02470 [archaeon]
MHKKVIGGSTYYYVTNRDNDGRHRTHYLGKDYETAKTKEREVLSKHGGLKPKTNFQKNLYLSLMILCGLGLLLLLGQITGFFTYGPTVIEFDVNESWNLSETFLSMNINNETFEFEVLSLVEDDKILFDVSSLEFSEGFYVNLIVGTEVMDSRYINVTEEVVDEVDFEILKAEVEERLGNNVASIEKDGGKYEVAVDLEDGKGSVILRVDNVSDVKRIQVIRLEDNVIQL